MAALAILALSALVLFPFVSSGPAEDGVIWETLDPAILSTTGPNITVQLRGLVENMGPGPGNTSRAFGFCLDDDPTLCFPDDFLTVEDSTTIVTGVNNQTPDQPLVTFTLDLLPETLYRVRFSLNESGLLFGFKPTDSAGILLFTTPAVTPADPTVVESHPLEIELTSLGLPLSLGLFIIGALLLGLGLFIVRTVGQGDDKDLLVVGLAVGSANVFLRFWPAIVLIFLALFAAWTIVSRLTAGPQQAGGG